jgi:hypothetical protein
MAWRMDKDGAALWEQQTADDLACRQEELAWRELNGRPWKMVNGLIADSGDPTALQGGFTGLEVNPNVATLATATINSSTVDVALWSVPTWTPIAANPQCPKAYHLMAFGIATTAATQGTISFQARFGQVQTSPSIGLSASAAPTASETQTPWRLEGDLIIRAGGGATTGLVVASFGYHQGTATTGGSASLPVLEQLFGTTTGPVSVVTDGSVAAGLWVGGLAVTSTTNTFVTHGVIWASWN